MEGNVLNFDPSEFQVLEDAIEFDELIQRPETIRFYTLQEQTTDAFEKMIPKGKLTKFQREEVQKEVDRIRDLYTSYVIPMPEEYRLREPTYGKNLPWVHPVYATPDRKAYSWGASWAPLFENPEVPNYYNRLVAALPRPYADTSVGAPFPIKEAIEFLSEDGAKPSRGLPAYEITRTQRNDDKTITIVRAPAGGTEDVVNFTGYYLEKRPLPVPNPLPDHPFLKSNEPTYIDSTAPLEDVVPSLDAILTHAVPPTKDPYSDATPFLKLYDIKLSDIPWSTWRTRFPPVEVISVAPTPDPVEFPKSSQLAPPEKIVNVYKRPYEEGVSVRKWLMDQLDGGGFIPELLRTEVIDNGSVESVPGVDIAPAEYPTTTVAECGLLGTSFAEFQTKGLLRRSWTIGKGDKDIIKLQCIPLEFVKQERAKAGYVNRKPWKETTPDDLKKQYLRRLEEVRPVKEFVPKEAGTGKTPARPDSLRRAEVLAIQADPRRFAEDKVRDIQELLKETVVTNNVYTDPDGLFVFCGHTLALLGGDLAMDRLKYYEKWTARVNGFRVCKFCGEQINSDVEAEQDEYDAEGRKINRLESFEQTTFHGHGVANFTTGLEQIRPLFMLDTAHDSVVFLMLSLIQALPTAQMVEPLLKLGRQTAAVQFSKGGQTQIAQFSGAMGLATTALILQTHIPTLVPRRAFGPRPLALDGYPRDADKPGDTSIVDSLLLVLRKTFEQYPSSFGGPSQALVRAALNSPTSIKTTVLAMLGPKSPLIGRAGQPTIVPQLLADARAYRASNPPAKETPKALLPVVQPPKELNVIKSFGTCPSNRPIWTSGRPPAVRQDVPALRTGLMPAPTASVVPPSPSQRVQVEPVAKADIRTLLSATVSSKIKVTDSLRTNLLLASHLGSMFQTPTEVATVDPTQNPSELRDIGRGLLLQQLAAIQADPTKRTKYEEARFKDITLYTLMADYKEQRSEVNKIRASERLSYIKRMANKTDQDREIIGDLLRIGLAPYIITNKDRELFAREAELLQEELAREEDMFAEVGDDEIGIGLPRDQHDDGEEDDLIGVDHGDYGDRAGLPEGRDYQQPSLTDDAERSV